jgi:hypothetical protein
MDHAQATRAVVCVGDGRGFVVEGARLVIAVLNGSAFLSQTRGLLGLR